MATSVEELCEKIAEHRILPSTELSRLRARWFQPKREDVSDVNKFGQWLAVNRYLSAFIIRMLRDGKADLLRLNQYQLTDHLVSGPFAGAYLAFDPLQRHVVLEVLSAERTADPQALRAFQTAAEQAMTVRHPHVNPTLDFGEAKGRYYLVREFNEGETLADILAQRGKIQPIAAARLFALALLGLQALHEKRVPAGPLGAESILLSTAGKSAGGKARTVKILNAGVPRSHFDPAALDGAITAAPPEDNAVASVWEPEPREDIFRLGMTFYRSLVGVLPSPSELSAAGGHRLVAPIRQLAPEVPEMLANLVETMVDADPARRPAGAAQAAKGLRVFLASEEEPSSSRPEEQVATQPAAPVSAPAAEETPAASPSAEPAAGEQPAEEGEGSQQLKALWKELRPGQRDWVFLGVGAAAVILVVLFLRLLTGIGIVNVVCLLTGGALSFFVERLLRLREE
jgi:hypothetical protein